MLYKPEWRWAAKPGNEDRGDLDGNQQSDTEGSRVLSNVFPGLVTERSVSGVTGLAVDAVETDRGDSGLVVVLFDDTLDSGLLELGDAPDDLDFPWSNSRYSEVVEGFHEDR